MDWKRKLTSRKLWVSIAGFVAGLVIAFGASDTTAETVTGCIMAAASVVGYIFGEGLTDAAALKAEKAEKGTDKETLNTEDGGSNGKD